MRATLAAGPGRWLFVLVTLCALSACSLIFDADVFVLPDADVTPDARVDSCAEEGDAGLELVDIRPRQVSEGQGCLLADEGCDEGSRPIPVVIRGCNLAPHATITLAGAGLYGPASAQVISADHGVAAFALSVPVDRDRGADERDDIEVRITQDGESASLTLAVQWLDELVASEAAPGGTYNLDDRPLAPSYSLIDIDRSLTLSGRRAARFIATSDIVIRAAVSANASGRIAGPGGCDGGVSSSHGDCGDSGGAPGGREPGGQGAGGGGGGNADLGASGNGSTGGGGGAPAGDPTLTPLDGPAASRGHGGGGGGNGNGGRGGGGGGVIEVTSGGRLRIEGATVQLSARGASGGTGDCGLLTNGGGGGGGSGGALLVRAAAAFQEEDASATWVNVAGGNGASGCHRGGDGAPGRVRIDLPAADPLPVAIADQPHSYQGPMLATSLPAITRDARVTLTIYGAIGQRYWLQKNGRGAGDILFQDERLLETPLDLEPGRNEICVAVAEDITAAHPEGRNCLSIAYIP